MRPEKPKTKKLEMDPDLQAALRSVIDMALRANGINSFPESEKLIRALVAAPEKKGRKRK